MTTGTLTPDFAKTMTVTGLESAVSLGEDWAAATPETVEERLRVLAASPIPDLAQRFRDSLPGIQASARVAAAELASRNGGRA